MKGVEGPRLWGWQSTGNWDWHWVLLLVQRNRKLVGQRVGLLLGGKITGD